MPADLPALRRAAALANADLATTVRIVLNHRTTGAAREIRIADRSLSTQLDGMDVDFDGRLQDDLQFNRSLVDIDTGVIESLAGRHAGTMSIINLDGAFNWVSEYVHDGATVEIQQHAPGSMPLDDAVTIFSGYVAQIVNGTALQITFHDNTRSLDKPVLTEQFSGRRTGDRPEYAAGQMKPIFFGKFENYPVPQINDRRFYTGRFVNVSEVRVDGIVLAENLWSKATTRPYIQFVNVPEGRVTATFEHQSIITAADIIQEIVGTNATINAFGLLRLQQEAPQDLRVPIIDEGVTIRDVMQQVLASVHCSAWINVAGEITFFAIRVPDSSEFDDVVFDESINIMRNGVNIDAVVPAVERTRIAYNINYGVFDMADLDHTRLTVDVRRRLATDKRHEQFRMPSLRASRPNIKTREIDSFLINQIDARNMAQKRQEISALEQHFVRVNVRHTFTGVDLAEVVQVNSDLMSDRLRLGHGRVVEITEYPMRHAADLVIWYADRFLENQYNAPGVEFDGATHLTIDDTALLQPSADCVVSFFFETDQQPAGRQRFICLRSGDLNEVNPTKFGVDYNPQSEQWRVIGRDINGNTLLNAFLDMPLDDYMSGLWWHVMVSFTLTGATPPFFMTLNGVDRSDDVTFTQRNAGQIDFGAEDMHIGAFSPGVENFVGCMFDFVFGRKFIAGLDTTTGDTFPADEEFIDHNKRPIDIRPDASGAMLNVGGVPWLFCSGGAADFPTNRGLGPDMVVTGTLTDCEPSAAQLGDVHGAVVGPPVLDDTLVTNEDVDDEIILSYADGRTDEDELAISP